MFLFEESYFDLAKYLGLFAAEPLAALELALQPRSDAELSASPEPVHFTAEMSSKLG